jgi:hypothetical protein
MRFITQRSVPAAVQTARRVCGRTIACDIMQRSSAIPMATGSKR